MAEREKISTLEFIRRLNEATTEDGVAIIPNVEITGNVTISNESFKGKKIHLYNRYLTSIIQRGANCALFSLVIDLLSDVTEAFKATKRNYVDKGAGENVCNMKTFIIFAV
ncbi:MAG: hypothetical protein ACLQQ4_18430 [Bacteroidia bacterium]